jgi:hypothetical protein
MMSDYKIAKSNRKKKKLAGVEGLEPPAIGFGDRCSTNWNYTPAVKQSIR